MSTYDSRHGKEIDGHHLTEMVVKKGLPRLASQHSGDGAFADRDAEHLQFAMNRLCTPGGIGGGHSCDQSANLGDRSGPTSLASPESANPFALPAGGGVSLDIN